jgi:predicted RNase H-like nuclease (RuvC/YqgF family)
MVKVVKGILQSTTKLRETKTYKIVNRNDAERFVLVEHPVRNDFHLTDDTTKPAETASDVYRFEVKVPAGKTATQAVTEERVISQQVQLTNSNDDQIRFFLNQTIASKKVKDGLAEAINLRGAVNKTQREIAELQLQLKTITEDQARLRANLKEMPPTAAAYKRYLDKFDQQETQIEKYQADVKKMQETEHQQKKEYKDFLNSFSAN